MVRIPLSQGQFALIDDEDFELVNRFKWRMHNKGHVQTCMYMGMVGGKRKQAHMYLHGLIMRPPLSMEVDHGNHDKLDCRRSKMRVCTLKFSEDYEGRNMRYIWTIGEISGRLEQTRAEIKGKKDEEEYNLSVENIRAFCAQVEFLLNENARLKDGLRNMASNTAIYGEHAGELASELLE